MTHSFKSVITLVVLAVLTGTRPPLIAQEAADHPESRAQIREFFQNYQAATAEESELELHDAFDPDRIVDEIVRRAGVDVSPAMRDGLATAIGSRLASQLKAATGTWYRHQVLDIKFFGSDRDAEVFVRSWSENQTNNRQIFWLHRKAKKWQIYDVADLSTNINFTTMGSLALRQFDQQQPLSETFLTMRHLSNAVTLMIQEDIEGAAEAMAETIGRPVPPFAESLRWFLHAAVVTSFDSEAGLEYLDKAAAFQPDFPLLDYLWAVTYNALGRHELAIRHAQKYIDRFGADADAYLELAVAFNALEKPDEAIAATRQALVDTPNSIANLELLATLLPEGQKQELAQHFAKLRKPSEGFQYLADSFESYEETEALDVLVKEMEKINKNEPYMDYYRAVVLSQNQQHDQAFELVQTVLQNWNADADEDEREWYQYLFWRETVFADRMLQVYNAANDRQQMCSDLLDYAIDMEQFDRAQKLIDVHLKAFPQSSDAFELAANLSYARQDFEQAEQHFATAIELTDDIDAKNALMESRMDCWLQLDQPLEAYRRFDAKQTAFNELADYLFAEDDDDRLRQLIELHEKSFPKSLGIARWSAELLFKAEDYQAAISKLQPALQPPSEPSPITAEESLHLSRASHLLIQCLIRAKRLDEALAAANNLEQERIFYQALVYAAQGKLAAFRAAHRQCLDEYGYSDEDFVYHPDFPAGFADLKARKYRRPLRRVVLLATKPFQLDASSLIKAAQEALGVQVYQEDWESLAADDDQFLCGLTDDAFILAVDDYRLFVRQDSRPYMGDAEVLADLAYQDDVIAAIREHKTWLSVDVYVWPKDPDTDQEGGEEVPLRGGQLVGALAAKLAGDRSTVAFHDQWLMKTVTADFATKLSSDDPSSAFAYEDDEPAEASSEE